MCARRDLRGAGKGQWTAGGGSSRARLSDRLTHHKQLRLDRSVARGWNARESTAGVADGTGGGVGVWIGAEGSGREGRGSGQGLP